MAEAINIIQKHEGKMLSVDFIFNPVTLRITTVI